MGVDNLSTMSYNYIINWRIIMARFLVKWGIDIEADSAEDAARQALAIQRDPDSTATVFDVKNKDTGYFETVDFFTEG
jgi:hypothetical protein